MSKIADEPKQDLAKLVEDWAKKWNIEFVKLNFIVQDNKIVGLDYNEHFTRKELGLDKKIKV